MLAHASISGDLAALLLEFLRRQRLSLVQLEEKLSHYDVHSRMQYSDWWCYLEEIRDALQEPQVGLLIGLCVKTSDAGVLGYLTASCDTLAQALLNFQRYQTLLYEGDMAQVEMRADSIRFYWPANSGYSTKESDEVLISGLLSFFRQLLNDPEIKPLRVDFVNPPPSQLDSHQQILNCPVFFSQHNLAIELDLAFLQIKLPQSDQGLNALLQQQADNLLSTLQQQDNKVDRQQDAFLQQVRTHILKLLPLNQAKLEGVANALNTSARSLNRRLLDKQTSFKQLLSEVRFYQARQYLAQQLTHSEIALLLGYSEQSAFSRAFKSWAGVSPLQYQKAGHN